MSDTTGVYQIGSTGGTTTAALSAAPSSSLLAMPSISTDQSTIAIITGASPPAISFITPGTGTLIRTPALSVDLGVSAPRPEPSVAQFDPGVDPEGNLLVLPGFYGGGPGGDIFTGQVGDVAGNYINAGANMTYQDVTVQSYGTQDWMTVGTDLNNGSQAAAAKDMAAAVQRDLNGLPLQTPPGNAAVGFVELFGAVGFWCGTAVAAAGISGVASVQKNPISRGIGIMAAAGAAAAVWKCEQVVLNPDQDEMAAYDAIMHTVYSSAQSIEADFGTFGGGGPNAAKPSTLASKADTDGSIGTSGLLTSNGATVDWTKSLIDPVSHQAIHVIS